jgi:hypothetical protein
MSCKRKTKNTAAQTNSAASVSTVFAVPEADEAGEAAVLGAQTELAGETAEADESAGGTSPWSDVSMRRYVHPIPAACTGCGCQSCPCQSCLCQQAEQTACLARLLRQQRDLLEEIRNLLMRFYPHL